MSQRALQMQHGGNSNLDDVSPVEKVPNQAVIQSTEIEMLRQIFKSLIVARQASTAFETLSHLSDHQNIKAQVLAEMDSGDKKS